MIFLKVNVVNPFNKCRMVFRLFFIEMGRGQVSVTEFLEGFSTALRSVTRGFGGVNKPQI